MGLGILGQFLFYNFVYSFAFYVWGENLTV